MVSHSSRLAVPPSALLLLVWIILESSPSQLLLPCKLPGT